MTVEEAIRTAIQYENRVRDVYRDAAADTGNPHAAKVLEVLASEEQGHVEYLEERLRQWTALGRVEAEPLETVVPPLARIQEGISQLRVHMNVLDREGEIRILQKALKVEKETSDFYRRMVAELPAEAQSLFRRFLEIEEGHLAIVEAELNSVSGVGFWFDFQEFKLG